VVEEEDRRELPVRDSLLEAKPVVRQQSNSQLQLPVRIQQQGRHRVPGNAAEEPEEDPGGQGKNGRQEGEVATGKGNGPGQEEKEGGIKSKRGGEEAR
jgi:hypothetical protein